MLKPTITIQIAKHDGVEVATPICEEAKLFAAIADRPYLTVTDLKHIKSLGYEFNIKFLGDTFGIIG